jgi:hypothetical protein
MTDRLIASSAVLVGSSTPMARSVVAHPVASVKSDAIKITAAGPKAVRTARDAHPPGLR